MKQFVRNQFRRGTEAQVEAVSDGKTAEPHYATDTKDLYIFDGTDNQLVGGLTALDAKVDVAGDTMTDQLLFSGDGRVTKSIWLGAGAVKAPGTKPATFSDLGISGVWQFSNGTDDSIVANVKLPEDMDRTVAPTFTVGWSTPTAVTTETAVWQLEYLYTAVGEDTSGAAQATITVDSNAVAQANGLVTATFPAMVAPSSTDVCVHCRVKRLGADADDDLTDDADLHGICIRYTSDKLGTAV